MSRRPATVGGAPGRLPGRVGPQIGQQLRVRRESSGISLRELARRLGVSPSALSQIETGKSRPSVSTLYAIVNELGMSLDELFDQLAPAGGAGVRADARRTTDREAAAAERVQRAAGREGIQLESGVRWERLTPTPDAAVDFLYVAYEVGGSSSRSEGFIRHAGREYGLVLSGKLEVTVGFDTYELGPGDSICFDSTTPHRLRNNGPDPVHGVWLVVGRGGDTRADGFEEG